MDADTTSNSVMEKFEFNKPVIIAGPCSVESEEQILRIAHEVKKQGVNLLRGGAFKPRTSFDSFQGLGEQALKYLVKARAETGLSVVSEIPGSEYISLFEKYVDVVQVGSRNMYNYWLLKKLGKIGKPVLLKRGMSATLNEFLSAAEYIVREGNKKVILCERGIRTFSDYTRNTLDLSIVPLIKRNTSYPIIVDPSHATGDSELVSPMAKAALAAGADGLMIELHHNPSGALSDGKQSLNFEQFRTLMSDIRGLR